MKKHFKILVYAGINRVLSALNNPNGIERRRQNFHAYRCLSGDPAQVSSAAEMRYSAKGKNTVLKETTTERREGNFPAATDESTRVKTTIVNPFEKIGVDKTRWISWCNFIFTGSIRLTSPLIFGATQKRTERDMQRFKLIVETSKAGEAR